MQATAARSSCDLPLLLGDWPATKSFIRSMAFLVSTGLRPVTITELSGSDISGKLSGIMGFVKSDFRTVVLGRSWKPLFLPTHALCAGAVGSQSMPTLFSLAMTRPGRGLRSFSACLFVET